MPMRHLKKFIEYIIKTVAPKIFRFEQESDVINDDDNKEEIDLTFVVVVATATAKVTVITNNSVDLVQLHECLYNYMLEKNITATICILNFCSN